MTIINGYMVFYWRLGNSFKGQYRVAQKFDPYCVCLKVSKPEERNIENFCRKRFSRGQEGLTDIASSGIGTGFSIKMEPHHTRPTRMHYSIWSILEAEACSKLHQSQSA
uniref:Uncharacterized protein n=1 Tax=Acrobeloides nanus TaxID=290746 RepID=A0A914CJ53_9BILA